MMKIKYWLVFFLACASSSALGQTACPTGVAAGSAQCGPSPASHGVSPSISAEPRIRYVPTGRWISKSGAIYVDSTIGDIGATHNEFSESDAARLALERCAKNGAKNCELLLIYTNQCGVIAWPSIVNAKVTSGSGTTIELASKNALDECKKNSSTTCSIVYAECSQPNFEKF
jgi:hypothetical protein